MSSRSRSPSSEYRYRSRSHHRSRSRHRSRRQSDLLPQDAAFRMLSKTLADSISKGLVAALKDQSALGVKPKEKEEVFRPPASKDQKFKKSSHEQQYKLNESVSQLAAQAQASCDLEDLASARSLLGQIVAILTDRQQDLLIADEFDWATVREYRKIPIAKDLPESNLIRSAYRRSRASVKLEKDKLNQRFGSDKPASRWAPNSGFRGPSTFGNSTMSSFRQSNFQPPFRPQRGSGPDDKCFVCGNHGHWANYCPNRFKKYSQKD